MNLRTIAELALDREPDSVPRARRLLRSALGEEMPEVAGDAELIVSELVTNACLHGEPPVIIRVLVNRVARIEVEDAGRSVPILLSQGPDAMTGRGLSMVAAVATSWGVEVLDGGGKVVWAELDPDGPTGSAAPPVDLDALLEAWADDDPTTATYAVQLGPVSTELLLAAKSHIDNVVRELMLMRDGAASSGVALPAELNDLIRTVTVEFAEARAEIKRQAAAAAARGDVLTDLELHLSPSAAHAGERYLAALDEADRYARSAHLLTLAPPRIHRLFRQWYVHALIDQLRAVTAGEEPAAATPFQIVLARELTRLDQVAATADRLATIQIVSADLARSVSAEAMARVAVERALEFLPVETARVRLLGTDAMLRSAAWAGRRPRHAHHLDPVPLGSDLPAAVAARTGRPVHIRSLTDALAAVPEMDGFLDGLQTGHFVPLLSDGETAGVLILTFAGGHVTDEAERDFVTALADVLAAALVRARATPGPHASTGAETLAGTDTPTAPATTAAAAATGAGADAALAVLSAQKEVFERMVAGEPLPSVLEALIEVVTSAGDPDAIGSVLLLDADGRHLRHGAARSLPGEYVEAIDGLEIGPSAGSCGTAAFTRRPVVVEDIAADPLWAGYRHLALPHGLRACWSTPILAGDGELLGTFAIYYRQARRPTRSEQELVSLLVSSAAVAIGRARADDMRAAALAHEHAARDELEQAHRNLRFVLEATTRVATGLDSDDTLRTLARLAVPTLADVCLIDLLDGVSFRRAATAASDQVDPEVAAALACFAPDAAGLHPAVTALRTGRIVLEPVDGALIARAVGDDGYADVVRRVGSSWCLAVPLVARGRNLGAMTLALVRAGRRFSEADQGMIEDLGRRVALAIDNAQLYESTVEAERRLALVVRAGVALTSSLELETVVAHLHQLLAGEVADRCEIHVRRTPEQWWRLGAGTGRAALVRADRLPPRVAQAVDSRVTVVVRADTTETFSPGAAAGGTALTTIVPLVAHGDVVGVITLASPGAEGPTRVPAETVDVIAGRAALAVDNALLYEQERTAAEILQRSLLPPRLPEVVGVRSAARYLPAGARNEIGGDWYDVFAVGADRLGVVMGDVMGRGIPAASIMGQLRNGLRMLALQETDPAAALGLLNRMLGADADSPLATVAYGVIDIPVRTITLANAGHLPPLLLRRSSGRYLEQKPGLPLGALPDPRYSSVVHPLEAGDTLVMYTDGLIEQRDRSLEEGLSALLSVGAAIGAADPELVCDRLLEAFHRGSDEDDTAALVICLD